MATWQPTASTDALIERARLLKALRAFFDSKNVIEVDTPLLSRSTITDVQLEGIQVPYQNETLYLQTSPEYAMKRLLAAGMPCIYQLGKVFRSDEAGRYHNPEFTMLEWYRLGFTLEDLMDETDALLHEILGSKPAQRFSYQALFEQYCHVNPHTASLEELKTIALEKITISEGLSGADKDTWLHLLFSHVIEPQIGFDAPVFVYDYPASQSALAETVVKNNITVAKRFEVYVRGIELANGYQELCNVDEQLARFENDNKHRREAGLNEKPIDPLFVEALQQGLPACSGIALGVDRLIMLVLNKTHIEEVLPFTHKQETP